MCGRYLVAIVLALLAERFGLYDIIAERQGFSSYVFAKLFVLISFCNKVFCANYMGTLVEFGVTWVEGKKFVRKYHPEKSLDN